MPYIARDTDGKITVFENKPYAVECGDYDVDTGDFIVLPSDWFPELTFDDGPAEIVAPGKAVVGAITFNVS